MNSTALSGRILASFRTVACCAVACLSLRSPALAQQTGTGGPPTVTLEQRVSSLPAGSAISAPPPELQRQMEELRKASGDIRNAAIQDRQAKALADARLKAKANDLDGAEESLTLSIPFQAESTQWHLDAAQRLRVLTDDLVASADDRNATGLIRRALAHIQSAEQKARQTVDVRAQVAAKLGIAYLYERYRGDAANALRAYADALQLDPGNVVAIEAHGRLERSLANLRARAKGGK